jgi:hypothetical protein
MDMGFLGFPKTGTISSGHKHCGKAKSGTNLLPETANSSKNNW